MDQVKTIQIKEYLISKDVSFYERNGELITKCIFSNCDDDSKANEFHLYFATATGQYECKKCGQKGNIFTLAKHFGDSKKDVIDSDRGKDMLGKQQNLQKTVEKCHQQLPERIRNYLNGRGIKDEVIGKYELGYGKFYNKYWITIPIKDKDENYLYFKLRQDPSTGSDKITYPKGNDAQIYDLAILKSNPEYIVICEGELDRLLLISNEIPAITSTHGVSTFKKEWVEELKNIKKIFICFDNDEPGKKGTTKLLELLRQELDAKLFKITLPEEVGLGGDLTDYLINCKGNSDELFEKHSEEYPKKIDTSKFEPLYSDGIVDILEFTIKKDRENKIVTFLCQILTYTDNDQFNISFNAPSSTGKSYIPLEVADLFPKEDVEEIGYCSPTAFFHDYGLFDRDFGGYIIDLSKKILVFLDQPHTQLIQHLRPLLSHDKKEIHMKITDKTQKYGLKTKNLKLIGFPSVIFCTTGLIINEQEATRFLLLSPETSQRKICEGVEFAIKKETDKQKYKNWLESKPERRLLMERIIAVKEQNIKEIIIENEDQIRDKFFDGKKLFKPRHQRDIKRVVSLIKAFALLNLWYRKKQGRTIYANEEDIVEGFKIWNKISASQELNIPPYVFNLYKEIIIPIYEDKNNNVGGMLSVAEGVSRKEVMSKHIEIYGRPINDFTLRQEIIPMLEAAGLIIQEMDPNDKRKMIIFPTESKV